MTMPATLVVREAHSSDMNALERLWSAWYCREALNRVAAGSLIYLVAELDGRVVGQLCIDTAALPEAGYVYAVSVDHNLRSQGIGTRMLREAEVRILERGFATVALKVEHTNDRARTLYERLGYQLAGDGFDEWDQRTPEGEIVRHVRVATHLMRRSLAPA